MEDFGLGLIFGSFHPPGTVAATMVPFAPAVRHLAAASGHSFLFPAAVAASVCLPDVPVALGLSFAGLSVFPAEQARVFFALTAVESARGLPSPAAGNGIAGYGLLVVAPPGDISHPNTAAGRQVTVHALEQSSAATGPIPFDAAPILGPSD